ncbi:XylR family transcriptional regulator [Stieleria varia]|nr:XylR family transcriptional regulator [Stieleria varia]
MVETSMAFGRRVLDGISRYLVENRPWSVQLDLRELVISPPAWLETWTGDGIITRSTTPEMIRIIEKLQVPTVNLTDIYGDQGLPSVLNDHHEIGRVAAQHLIDKGLSRFAFAGFSDHNWSMLRLAGFQNELLSIDPSVLIYQSNWNDARQYGWESEQAEIIAWLKYLPKPIGIFACNDFRGRHLLDACRQADISVPDEVAVLGVDNDHVLCDFCDPPLSSVIPSAERVGFEAAAMLDQLMRDETISNEHVLIAPLGVAERPSTEVLAIDDPDVVASIQLIRSEACNGLNVSDILKAVPIARSSLERRFRKFLGRSPQAEIRRVQIKRASQLLRETDLNVTQISTLAGFKHAEYFSVVFKRECGVTPGRYRDSSH